MTSKYRVLHIIPGFGGGISSFVRNIISGINADVVTIDIAGFTDFPADYKEEVYAKGGQTFILKNVRVSSLVPCLRQFRAILKDGHYDAVHLHLNPLQDKYFSVLSKVFGIKRILVHAHQSSAGERSATLSKLIHPLEKLLTTSSGTDLVSCSRKATEYRFGLGHIRKQDVTYIPNSIDAERYFTSLTSVKQRNLKSEIRMDDCKLHIVHVGYFGFEKNHPFMFKIAKGMKDRGLRFQWYFIGNGKRFDECKKMSDSLGLSGYVYFLGRRSDVPQLLRLFDVFVLPSISEGLPTVVVESQAAGTPVVMSSSVTDECDMHLGILSTESIQSDVNVWVDKIIESSQLPRPNISSISQALVKYGFTDVEAAKGYERLLLN